MSRSPTTAEATPDARRTIAPVARTPATTFLLTFSARAKASAAMKTIAEMMTANQMAQDFDTARKIRDAHITVTAIPITPNTGTSTGFIILLRSSALAMGSPVARSAHALIISSNAVVKIRMRPTTKIAVCVTNPITRVPRPTAPIMGQ